MANYWEQDCVRLLALISFCVCTYSGCYLIEFLLPKEYTKTLTTLMPMNIPTPDYFITIRTLRSDPKLLFISFTNELDQKFLMGE